MAIDISRNKERFDEAVRKAKDIKAAKARETDSAINMSKRIDADARYDSATQKAPDFKAKRARSDGGLQVTMDGGGDTFSQAFAKARKEGKSTFSWKGKDYSTKRADDKPKTSEGVEYDPTNYKCGGKTKKYARGGGVELRGKTRGRII